MMTTYVDIGDDIMMSSSEACHEMVAITHLHIHDSSACLGAIVIVFFFMIFIVIVSFLMIFIVIVFFMIIIMIVIMTASHVRQCHHYDSFACPVDTVHYCHWKKHKVYSCQLSELQSNI